MKRVFKVEIEKISKLHGNSLYHFSAPIKATPISVTRGSYQGLDSTGDVYNVLAFSRHRSLFKDPFDSMHEYIVVLHGLAELDFFVGSKVEVTLDE